LIGVVEPVLGDLQLTPGWRESCERSTLDAGSPFVVAFQKSGGYSSDHPQSDAYRAYFEDPELRLTPGRWHVYAVADFWLGSCGGEHHELRAEITIVVDEPAAAATPTPVPTRPPSGVALPYPEGCVVYGLSERRCAFIVDEARLQRCLPGRAMSRGSSFLATLTVRRTLRPALWSGPWPSPSGSG
jgi:hypothetical protein